MTPDELLADHSSEIATLANWARRVVRTAMPEAEERVYPGWHGFGYVHPVAGYLCGVFPQSEVVKLAFEHGHLLADPDGLFSAGGTQVRYVVLSANGLPAEGAIADLIADAIDVRTAR